MDVNSILCVGRSGTTASGNKISTVRVLGHKQNSATSDIKTNFNEPRVLPVTPSRQSRRDQFSPTKSILRSKSPSPNHTSPSNGRNVRFSDKDNGGNYESTSAVRNLVSSSVQTEEKPNFNSNNENFDNVTIPRIAKRQRPLSYESKTSTPRYSPNRDLPEIDFGCFESPRARPTSPGNGEKTERSSGEKTVTSSHCAATKNFCIHAIEKKDTYVKENGVQKEKQSHFVEHLNVAPDGDKIIRNFPFHKGHEASMTAPMTSCQAAGTQTEEEDVPGGKDIVENPDFQRRAESPLTDSSFHLTTVSTQTTFEDTPDGNSIIKNLEIGMSGRSVSPVENKPEIHGENTTILDDDFDVCCTCGRGMKLDLSTQTGDTNESVRSQSPDFEQSLSPLTVSVAQQTDTNYYSETDNACEDETDFMPPSNAIMERVDVNMAETLIEKKQDATTSPRERDKGVQAGQSYDCIDGPEINKSNSFSMQVDADEFDLLESSSKEAISTGVQVPEPEIKKPDGNSIIKNMTVKHVSPERPKEKNLNDPKWKEFVKNFDKPEEHSSKSSNEENSSVLDSKNEQVSLQKVVELKPCERLSEHSARSLIEGDRITKLHYNQIVNNEMLKHMKNGKSSTKEPPFPRPQTPSSQYDQPKRYSLSPVDYKDQSDFNLSTFQSEEAPTWRKRSNSLGFTSIETYSFKPETLKRKVSKLIDRHDSVTLGRKTLGSVRTESPKQSLTRNQFIQGLDLGPVPNLKTPSSKIVLSSTDRSRRPMYSSTPLSGSTPTKHSLNMGTNSIHRYSYLDISNSSRSGRSRSTRQTRSSSEPPFRRHQPPSSLLTPSLNQMRSTVVRKHATADLENQTHRSRSRSSRSLDRPSSRSRNGRFDRYFYQSKEDALLKQWAISPPRAPNSADVKLLLSMDSSRHRHQSGAALSSEYRYRDALKHESNRRPKSRESSPLNSKEIKMLQDRPSSPRKQLDSSLEADKEVQTFIGAESSDEDSYVSLETSRSSMIKPKRHRAVTRKPPIPLASTTNPWKEESTEATDMATATHVRGREPIKQPSTVRTKSPQTGTNKELKNEKLVAPKLTRSSSSGNGTIEKITIGKVPDGLEDKSCLYLGNDIIQKVIEDAKL